MEAGRPGHGLLHFAKAVPDEYSGAPVSRAGDGLQGSAPAGETAPEQRPAAHPSVAPTPVPPVSALSPTEHAQPQGAEQPTSKDAERDEEFDALDKVIEGRSSVDGRAVMVIGATGLILLGGATRHARSLSLLHAAQLGDVLFGNTSYAVLEGPLGTEQSFFWAIATAPAVSEETLGDALIEWTYQDQKISFFGGLTALGTVTDLNGHRYRVHVVFSLERRPLTQNRAAAEQWVQVSASAAHRLEAEELQALVFDDLDHLVDAVLAGATNRLQEAADRLSELDEKAFVLADEPAKEKYLKILIRAWTLGDQRRAIVEIMRSLDSLSQVKAVKETLSKAGLYEQLFADLDSELWKLLTTVGKKFAEHKPVSFHEFDKLLGEAFKQPKGLDFTVERALEANKPVKLALAELAEYEEAARAATGFLLTMLDSLKMMVTEPEKILAGLVQLVRLMVAFRLASFGHAPSQRECDLVLRQIGRQLADGLRGAALLEVGERAKTRIKWAMIVEVASWFVGVGELKAAAEAVGLTEKVAAILRFLGLIEKLAKPAEAEVIAARLSRVAKAMHGASAALKGLKGEEEVLHLLSQLPEEDGAWLGRVLQRVDVPEGSTLATIAAHPELGPAAHNALRKADILQTFAAKSGGLTEELGLAFRRLAGKDGFEAAELAKIAHALQAGEGARFTALLEHIGFGRIGPKARAKADFLSLLAQDSRRMDSVRQFGFEVVQAVFDRSGAEVKAFDTVMEKLGKLQADMGKDKAVEFSELLDRLRTGDPTTWKKVAAPPRVRPVKASAADRAPVLQRIAEIRKRYPSRKVKDPKLLKQQLKRLTDLSRSDPAKALEHLERFEEALAARAGKEADLAAEFAAAEAKASQEAKALHHEPDEVPPQALTPTDKPRQKLGRAGRASSDLERNMAAIGQRRPRGHDTHHIIADADRRGAVARDILEWAGINPRDNPLNGIHLPRSSMDPGIVPQAATRHQTLHTDEYFKEVTRRLVEARKGGKGRVIEEMAKLKEELIHGPFHHTSVGGKEAQSYVEWLAEHKHELEWLTEAEQNAVVKTATRPPRAPRAAKPPKPAKASRKRKQAPGTVPAESPAPSAGPAETTTSVGPAAPRGDAMTRASLLRSRLDYVEEHLEALSGHPHADRMLDQLVAAKQLQQQGHLDAATKQLTTLERDLEVATSSAHEGILERVFSETEQTRLSRIAEYSPSQGTPVRLDVTSPPVGDATGQLLLDHTRQAVRRFEDEGLTIRQAEALKRIESGEKRSNLYDAFRGARIDEFCKESVLQDKRLADIYVTVIREEGPDFLDAFTGKWYDMTTTGAWKKHVQKYRRFRGEFRLPTEPM
ncbi:AHH domain-containing protein [Streptomyces bobili]|uniref:AHH domain-containing protein n=1 Tax=Streptomyces bobili TaxID=67280 RepID=UPI0036EB309D